MSRVRVIHFLFVLLPVCVGTTTGCSTFTQKGSVYRETGRVIDLFVEPTLDIQDTLLPSWPPILYDADGHGIWDVPVVASEITLYVPFAVAAVPMLLIPPLGGFFSHPFQWRREDGFGEKAAIAAMSSLALAYGAVTVGPLWVATPVCVEVVDVTVHDTPVVVVGKPVGMVFRLAFGGQQAVPSDTQQKDEQE